jgi:hypothetical protein
MTKNKWTVASIITVSLLLAGWMLWGRQDPKLVQAAALRDQLFDSEELPREQRRELWGQLREQMEQLTPEQRDELFAERRREWEAREDRSGRSPRPRESPTFRWLRAPE